ncbi:nitroreductase [Desulfogranum marinum]|uniref:nitroreductase n=1 Tax=Desulfogranum marinum TaxID=453220 RepID=UPI0029C60003|nr:nitroreductase [Desulfogranum marinum]
MNVHEALLARKSTRAFLDKKVSKEKIVQILQSARHAPSGTNAQPWQVAVVTGQKKTELTTAMENAFKEGSDAEMDYQYYPLEWHDPYKKRRVSCGAQLYDALNIKRQDKVARLTQWAANYQAFGAPVILFFFLDPVMKKGSFLDYGMFIQSIMLAAVEEGLATCAQAALGQFPKLVKTSLGYDQETILIGGMALGYENKEAPVNNYRTPREEVEVFTRFFDE